MDNLENTKDSVMESSLQTKHGMKNLRPHFVIFADDDAFHTKVERLLTAAKNGVPLEFKSRKEARIAQKLLGGKVFTAV